MKEWLVAGAVIEADDGLLLVQNRRRSGGTDWSTPGGVIDAGETVLEGLSREVTEETGLVVSGWAGPLYGVEVTAPGLGWNLRVEVHAATGFSGQLAIADPDGIVVDARFVSGGEHAHLLGQTHPWVGEPLCDWFELRWEHGPGRTVYRYQIAGDDLAKATVVRLGR